ncbi:isopentenyl-diphosphate Delta-isomerase [Nocardia mexicana]|uniref:Isopentenyl-diphosphate Delta-isomerase n=1 Tax=Nocardia mexicana TaxID=279262 RepID=A0A370HE48_9NOCA|nr:isopentenyl-diphosphate Delta-isomerase [Nocardia mexicana]RDI55524.1 isopentenyl-diphosphate delta-isomerase [Nocardia mexicana]
MASGTGQFDTDRESLLVELVDGDGFAVGSCSVARAHHRPGRLHRAFSVLLYDASGRVLLQRRADVKTRFPGLWSNACCGHPAPGQDVVGAATIRLKEELGTISDTLTEVGVYRYRALDPLEDQEENEWDHVLVGTLTEGALQPDPAEVSECTWVDPAELHAALTAEPDRYTPWLLGVLEVARPELTRDG